MFTVIAAWLVGSLETKHAVFLKRYWDSKFFQWAIFLCKASFCLPCSDQYELLIVSDFLLVEHSVEQIEFYAVSCSHRPTTVLPSTLVYGLQL